jgi:hypothetical protein
MAVPPEAGPQAEASLPAHDTAVSMEADDSSWRGELTDRLTRYRARRKIRPPRYPSLRLQFDAYAPSVSSACVPPSGSTAGFEPMMDRALALDRVSPSHSEERIEVDRTPAGLPTGNGSLGAHSGAKIIEFPRFAWAPPPPPPDQLAEPVSEQPRILEVAEVAPAPPALGGITIEPCQVPDVEKRPGIDFPLQSGSVGRRVIAGLVDGLTVSGASALFGFIFWKVAAIAPPRVQVLGLAAAVPALFWVIYQYLLIVYTGRTPGLWAAGLELSRFDGTSTTRSIRRWRVLASYLSAASLGMGYAWVFLDEDALCWHDRITHTYLAPQRRSSTGGKTNP